MYWTRRKMIIIGAVILLVIIVLIVLWFVLRSSQPNDNDLNNGPQVYDSSNADQVVLPSLPSKTEVSPLSQGAATLARNFVERYLSFSNDAWGSNLSILQSQMSVVMQQTSEQDLRNWQNQYPAGSFYGVSTKVLSQEQLSASEDYYSARLTVQQEETAGSEVSISRHQYDIKMRQAQGEWYVNDLIKVD